MADLGTRHHRRSIRLKGYDYAQTGAYFVTICTQGRACLFGDITDGRMNANDAGAMVQVTWDELPVFYPGVDTDAFVVMPNHIHGIVCVGAGPRACPPPQPNPIDASRDHRFPGTSGVSTSSTTDVRSGDRLGSDHGQARGPAPTETGAAGVLANGAPAGALLSLSDIVQRFKMLTTKRYSDGVKGLGWPAFHGRLWQRNYYEHIVRDQGALERIRQYIEENPLRWEVDHENPAAVDRGTGTP